MTTFTALLLAGSILGGVSAIPSQGPDAGLLKRDTVIKSGEGIGPDGFFYTVWDDGNMQQTFTNKDDGAFGITWSGNGDVVAGKGWKEGSDRNITYSGTYETGGMSFLMVYGWFLNPLVEYYIMENWDDKSDPSKDSDMQYITTLNTDGSDYDVYKKTQVNWPSIIGTATFAQYRSVRKNGRRTSGTVNMGAHFNAWRAAGLTLNENHYQVLAIEGMQTGSSGSASIKVNEENTAPVATSPAPAPAPAPSSSSVPPPPPTSSSTQPPPPPPATSTYSPAPAPMPESTTTVVQQPSPVPAPPSSENVPPPPAPTTTQAAPSAPPAPPAAPAVPSSSGASPTRSRRLPSGRWGYRHRKGQKSTSSSEAPAPTPVPQQNQPVVDVVTTVTFTTVYETVAAST